MKNNFMVRTEKNVKDESHKNDFFFVGRQGKNFVLLHSLIRSSKAWHGGA